MPTHWRGPKRKDLRPLKEWIMGKVEAKGEVRWKELWSDGQLMFKSPKYLSKCLSELIEEEIIEQCQRSSKDIRYRKAGAFNLLSNLISLDKQWENTEPSVLEELRQLNKKHSNSTQITAYITAVILAELRLFMFGLEKTVKASTELHTRWGLYLLGHSVRRFGNKLVTCGRAYQEETDRALKIAYWNLNQPVEELNKAMSSLPPLEPLPDLDMKQIKEAGKDFERMLKTLEKMKQDKDAQ